MDTHREEVTDMGSKDDYNERLAKSQAAAEKANCESSHPCLATSRPKSSTRPPAIPPPGRAEGISHPDGLRTP
jgi:hypothetical protein